MALMFTWSDVDKREISASSKLRLKAQFLKSEKRDWEDVKADSKDFNSGI